MKIINVVKAIFVSGQLKVMLNKVRLRFSDKKNSISQAENFSWLETNKSDIAEYCMKLDERLWSSIQCDVDRIYSSAINRLKEIPVELGGGGASPLLYFMVRFCKPKVVVETGVAAGFSSYAMLDALDKNESGHLHSSDFPYFRLPNPERFIGIVVPDSLKGRWSLFVKGDDVNLPIIAKDITAIDLFHYDSDKSYTGRMTALEILSAKITPSTYIIFDDIQDNSFFHDLVSGRSNWRVFEFEGKWVGLIYPM